MIDSFSGEYRFLSNFWVLDEPVIYEGLSYYSTETAYQRAKTQDPDEAARFTCRMSPGSAKSLGRKVSLREDWDNVKVSIMQDLVLQKFVNNEDLGRALVATGERVLIEGNHWNDTFWGVCRGKGQNRLGRILMAVREGLRPVYYVEGKSCL